jgi:hypothetical protein
VIGYPFNPAHLIPLVEVVGGAKTAPEARGSEDDHEQLSCDAPPGIKANKNGLPEVAGQD